MPIRIAVVGGGTTGFMVAAHISKHFPHLELLQIVDPRIPIIGVGEGTTPGFRQWMDDLTGLPFEDLERDIRVTRKRGVRFENWGRVHAAFHHAFIPNEAIGLHLSAPLLVTFLRRHVRGDLIEANVSSLHGGEDSAIVQLEDGSRIEVDIAVDARGFPRALGEDHIRLSWIPTNAALVTRTPMRTSLAWTRAVARPYGWVFVIPLTVDTAYGYIYGRDTGPIDDVKADFRSLLASEEITEYADFRGIEFPNFVSKRAFEGRVLKIGNTASFIEPLEATAIAIVRHELIFLDAWLRGLEATGNNRIATRLGVELNRKIVELALEVSLFIGWHYAEGSRFDTTFWRRAKQSFAEGLARGVGPEMRARFLAQLDSASRVPVEDVPGIRSVADLDRLIPSHRTFPPPFGGMTPLGFAQVGTGIGYDWQNAAASCG